MIRYSSKRERRPEREAAPRKERWKKRLKTATKTETSLSRCERSVETEEGVKRWWRRRLKGDGDGGVKAGEKEVAVVAR